MEINIGRRRPQNVGRGRPMELHIGQRDVHRTSYFNVLRTLVEDALRMSVGDVPWRYIEDHMSASIGRLLGSPQDVILPSGW